jgi:ABC-type antimicrobial peptide transport system permease subunit
MGIRVALGATDGDVIGNVLGGSARLFGVGIALGLMLSFAAGQVMRGTLYGVSATYPLVFAFVPALVGAVALAASYLPARRAARVDPLVALRCE